MDWILYLRCGLGVSELCAGVHAERASSAAEPVALGAVAAAVAQLAVQLLLVFGTVGRVQTLVAHA